MPEARLIFLHIQEGLSSLNYVPLVLKFVETGFITHKELQHIFSQLWLSAFEHIFNTDIVHVAISQVSLPGFVDCLESLNVVMHLIFDIGFGHIEFRDSIGVLESFFDILVGNLKC